MNINDIQTAVRNSGSHWFDPSTMRFFKCRVLDEVYSGPGGVYFVSSERGPHGPRRYTVRQFIGDKIDTVGEFNELTKGTAQRAAKRLASTCLDCQLQSAYAELSKAVTGVSEQLAEGNLPIFLRRMMGAGWFQFANGFKFRPRKYADGSGVYLEVPKKAGNPEAWRDAYKLQSELCRVLMTVPAEPAVSAEPLNPVTELEQFVHECRTHGNSSTEERDARQLIQHAKAYTRLMVAQCNGPIKQSTKNRLKDWIINNSTRVGAAGVLFGGDPRGCVVKLTWPDGATNDFGKEGWCVPV